MVFCKPEPGQRCNVIKMYRVDAEEFVEIHKTSTAAIGISRVD